MLSIVPGHLAAEARRREHLSGVASAGRVEAAAEAVHGVQVVTVLEEDACQAAFDAAPVCFVLRSVAWIRRWSVPV